MNYNPETGIFTWNCSRSGFSKDLKVGNSITGYLRIRIFGSLYLANQLAWLYTYGYTPENQIDHINRNKLDNRIENLREVSQSCNRRNIGNQKNNNSGVKGVSWYKLTEKWVATICVNRKKKCLGYYKSFDNAVCARLSCEQCLDWEGCESSSPAYKYVQKMLNRS